MKPQAVYFYSRGIRCEADLYQPDASGPRPCIVMAHGFGGIRAASLDHFAERFRDAGLAVLVFDYRHFGTSALATASRAASSTSSGSATTTGQRSRLPARSKPSTPIVSACGAPPSAAGMS